MANEIKGSDLNLVKKTRKSPVPANADRIMQGALKLSLKERVDLKNALSSSIEKELAELESNLQAAKEMVK